MRARLLANQQLLGPELDRPARPSTQTRRIAVLVGEGHVVQASGPVACSGSQETVARMTESLQHEPKSMWSALLASRAQ